MLDIYNKDWYIIYKLLYKFITPMLYINNLNIENLNYDYIKLDINDYYKLITLRVAYYSNNVSNSYKTNRVSSTFDYTKLTISNGIIVEFLFCKKSDNSIDKESYYTNNKRYKNILDVYSDINNIVFNILGIKNIMSVSKYTCFSVFEQILYEKYRDKNNLYRNILISNDLLENCLVKLLKYKYIEILDNKYFNPTQTGLKRFVELKNKLKQYKE